MVGVDPGAVRRPDPRRIDQILDEHRPTGERPVGGATQGLVQPGDRRVEGVDHGTTATASSSISAPGTASAPHFDDRPGRAEAAESPLPRLLDQKAIVDRSVR